jgi:hypothetical protein
MRPEREQPLDPASIEARATGTLEAVPDFIWDGEELPIPVEDIVDSCFGLLVRDVEEMAAAPVPGGLGGGEWISGLLLASRGEIWVNAEDGRRWPPRRRFTIGHELGHWELHRSGQQTLFCRSGHVEPSDSQPEDLGEPPPGRPLTEEEADVFSAALLMPTHLIERHRIDCGEDVGELCRRFDCSEKAMRRRLASLRQ